MNTVLPGTVPYRPKPGRSPPSPACTGSATPIAGCSTSARRRTSGRGCRTTSRRCAPCTSAPGAWSRPRRRVEWTVVGSDVEALQLEITWINEFDPPFNVQFRDDKSYPYLAVTLGDEAPARIVTRNRRHPGARYFGPYPKVWAVNETLDLMIKLFPIRTCNDSDYKRAMRERQALLRRADRPVLRAVLGQGHDRGASRERRPVRRVHAEPGPALHRRARRST